MFLREIKKEEFITAPDCEEVKRKIHTNTKQSNFFHSLYTRRDKIDTKQRKWKRGRNPDECENKYIYIYIYQ